MENLLAVGCPYLYMTLKFCYVQCYLVSFSYNFFSRAISFLFYPFFITFICLESTIEKEEKLKWIQIENTKNIECHRNMKTFFSTTIESNVIYANVHPSKNGKEGRGSCARMNFNHVFFGRWNGITSKGSRKGKTRNDIKIWYNKST